MYFCNNANAFHGNHFLFFYPIELKIDHQPSITKASVREGSNFPTHNPIQLSHFPINQTDPYKEKKHKQRTKQIKQSK